MINIVKEEINENNINDIKDCNILNKNKKKIIECKLNNNIFNPTKNSPINNWQYRLIKRLNDLDKYDLLKLDSFKLDSFKVDLLNDN